ncbi:MAG TPA: gamma-glutamyltransferase [Vicinamibacterales bacterium]|jgi:gamma-glutamyltranspeptidase/glutathione hydrolase
MLALARPAAVAVMIVFGVALPSRIQTSADKGVASQDGLVVCTSAPACDAGAAILSRGGNAVDAAVATAFALAVTHPSAGNIGGGGFMVVRAATGAVTTFDYREKAPQSSTRTMYMRNGKVDISLTNEGYLAPGVPGTVRGLALAHKRFGTLPWKDVVMPAVEIAEAGFVISPALARSLNAQLAGVMGKYPASVAAYGKPGGGQWAAGDRLVLGDLARTLRAIATDGADVFYRGWIADRIADDLAANGGLITRADLGAYEARERAPVTGEYRGYDIAAMPPPSSGGVALVEMLNILEPYDLKSKGAASAEARHLEIEAMRRAYLDRARFLGDPDFVQVPVASLTAKDHAKEVAANIDPARASSSAEIGKDILTLAQAAEPDETTHFSVIDRGGMAVSNTFTLEGGYGSRVVVKGAGFLLNNEMGDFNKNPGVTDDKGTIGTPANLIDPGKRMLSSMTPVIVSKDGKLVLVTGSPGGRTIINTVFAVVLNVTAFEMNVREAVDAPRMDHEWMPDSVRIERGGADDALLASLKAMGHLNVSAGGFQGDANSILIDGAGTAWGAADTTRSADGKASVPSRASTSAVR